MDADEAGAPGLDISQFKAALGCFATGVTIGTTQSALGVHGVTANAVMSVSLEPPLVLLSIQSGTRMDYALRNSDNFALSVLSVAQREIAEHFADPAKPHDETAFALFPHFTAWTGAPLLEGALAYVDCRIAAAHQAGDHTLFVGRAVYVRASVSGAPLLYFRGELS